ncbi:MAG: DNA-binding protein [Flavobacteriales bacterium]|nr:DNA-binding protein [Flavobacteriales bacterium]MBK9286210.1 DNA-binding protein [Flavobacteriales bacterium]MBL0034580.1 DNA-binding protein [Flavobacteriales bacterium]
MKQAIGTSGPVHVLRLEPGEDLRPAIQAWATKSNIEAATVISAVGSLSAAHLRYAGRADGIMITGELEVCSFSGTLAKHGLHLHLSVADRDGAMVGGHLLPGCIVRTTMELVIQQIEGVRMARAKDMVTTYDELDPQQLPSKP